MKWAKAPKKPRKIPKIHNHQDLIETWKSPENTWAPGLNKNREVLKLHRHQEAKPKPSHYPHILLHYMK
jgi:hypothetical protein